MEGANSQLARKIRYLANLSVAISWPVKTRTFEELPRLALWDDAAAQLQSDCETVKKLPLLQQNVPDNIATVVHFPVNCERTEGFSGTRKASLTESSKVAERWQSPVECT